ncbi:MAG: hypothetical protein JWR19_851 [Pedosphaera sp.]|nr:hypothetical protein [Pedosphaera sp.]
MLPAFVMVEAQVDLHERPPFGSFGLADKVYARFVGSVIGLAGIARDAGADNVFPGGRAAAVAGYNVVQI